MNNERDFFKLCAENIHRRLNMWLNQVFQLVNEINLFICIRLIDATQRAAIIPLKINRRVIGIEGYSTFAKYLQNSSLTLRGRFLSHPKHQLEETSIPSSGDTISVCYAPLTGHVLE